MDDDIVVFSDKNNHSVFHYDPYASFNPLPEPLVGDRLHDVFLSLTEQEFAMLHFVAELFLLTTQEYQPPFDRITAASLYKKIATVCGLTSLNIVGVDDGETTEGIGRVEVVEYPYLNFTIKHYSRIPIINGSPDGVSPTPEGFTTVTADPLDLFKFTVQHFNAVVPAVVGATVV